ncbi:hypothetical protein Cni_G06555 [Canna indica]|uniref:LysM domain receptor-like kinase 4 n=1 Tax=Canna indica TaxID=4628 RepID=A0AAQ3JZI7_9LILI|nr:hypothetical protein Cni_G06555 [Canna indica]
MASQSLTLVFLLLSSLPSLLLSQQPYEGILTTDCYKTHNSSSLLGYFCNAQPSCQSYLTFHSQPPFDSVTKISSLLVSDPSLLSQANSVAPSSTFPTNTKILIPVNCSCSGIHYQLNSSYRVINTDTALVVANNTFQGLSTCQAIMNQSLNGTDKMSALVGHEITIPLRCACPTENQTSYGVRYLLSYLVEWGDTISQISSRFGVDAQSMMDANQLTDTDILYPFTTLLIPFHRQPNITQLETPSPPPQPPPTAPPTNTGSSSNHAGLYAGIAVAAAAALLIAVLSVIYFIFKAKKKKKNNIIGSGKIIAPSDSDTFGFGTASSSTDKIQSEDMLSKISELGHALRVYKFEELQLATENFSYECLIEGSVYRGVFNGDAAAIKVVNRDVSREIEILKKINHFNLIKLSGIGYYQGQWFLVYEYAENGSLSNWILDRGGSKVLSWTQRTQIAVDVANGLSYLHGYTKPAYVHKDIKSSNILLDQTMRAKIANFGVARESEGSEGEFVLTKHIVGTKRYLAPEYLEHGLVSPKLDVYAFGVVMMEMITGKDALEAQREGSLVDVLTGEDQDATEGIGRFVDPLLGESYPVHLALEMARLIERCLRREAGSRPEMEEVAQDLVRIHAMSLIWQQP